MIKRYLLLTIAILCCFAYSISAQEVICHLLS